MTTRSFSAMLNEYLAEDLLRTEYDKRDYIMSKVEKDDSWKGGSYIVPFEGAFASTAQFGTLAASGDISEYAYVRGSIAGYKELWGSLVFNDRDLVEHDGKIKESTFLKILPNQIEQFMNYMKMVSSIQMGTGPHMAKVDVDGTAGGVLGVDKVDRFQLGQKLVLDDDNSAEVTVYVIAINVNDETITVSATRGGAALDVSAYTVAQNAKLFHPGAEPSQLLGFTSLRSALLSSANGGGSTLHGQTKTAYPFLQAKNVSGASINASNILEKMFDAYTSVKSVAVGSADTFLMSYKNLGSAMKLIETQKGGFKVTPTATKASQYGWTEIEITSVKGTLKLVGIQEMDDDIIPIIDWSALKFASNGMFRKRKNPGNGNEFYEVRATSGYTYIVDVALFGDLVVRAPNRCGIIHGISY